MRTISTEKIYDAAVRLIGNACTRIEPCALRLLQRAAASESNPQAAFALRALDRNQSIAAENRVPVCQDTGMCVFFLDIGQDVRLDGPPPEDELNRAVRHAYREFGLRMSVADPVTRKNTGDNTPAVIHTRIVPGSGVKLTFLPKGFGSENMSRLFMLTPSQGIEGVKNAVVSAVFDAGSNPCPPVIVGVGIGGTSDYAMLLAKKALLRPAGHPSPRPDMAELERELLTRINALGIGAQGFGGDATALAVHAEIFPTHIAALPVGVNIQCNCSRLESEEI